MKDKCVPEIEDVDHSAKGGGNIRKRRWLYRRKFSAVLLVQRSNNAMS